ncbi:MAG: hypothetical protein GTO40_27370, partial [Deltaproteobacteria bacterium]|nr:hypothetical protein [Deltaproteobacteria bacterium]
MKRIALTIGLVLMAFIVSLMIGPMARAQPPSQEEVREAIARGVEWLAQHQNDEGSWGSYEKCAVTALVVKKLEHHAVDEKWGLGKDFDSPFDAGYPYNQNVVDGWSWL